ncbi:MAG: sensor histidine kinase [Chloroflexota bacterium]
MKLISTSWRRLTTLRSRLVLWYLGILAAVLLGLGIYQSITLTNYLRVTTSHTLHDTARAELAVLGPCFIRSTGDLNLNAPQLARLLGSHDIAVKIVTPAGATLADHGFGEPGHTQPMRLPASTIQTLIKTSAPSAIVSAPAVAHSCLEPPVSAIFKPHPRHHTPRPLPPALNLGDLLLIAAPLGPHGHPVGYAILGRSMVAPYDTVRQTRVAFTLGALVALLLAALFAIPIINRALRPLNRVARAAEAIAAGDLGRRANLTPSADEVGRLGRAFDTMVDRLQDALSSATTSEQRMRQFLADASHELRTPLTVLRGTSQILLRQRVEEKEYVAALADIHLEAVRLSRLVDDLLTLTRLDAGQALDPRSVALREFIELFISRYGSAWSERVIQFNAPSLDRLSASVDPEALRRILTNLIDNAARYSTPGEPITLSGAATVTTVSILVRDEGPGMSDEDAERVFERFYRANKSRARQSGGTGLGLSIVHTLVGASGGKIHLDTSPDRGTTVAVTLPRSFLVEPSMQDQPDEASRESSVASRRH